MKESSFFTSALLLAFIVLKLCGVIAWSWWWVLAPAWIPLVFSLSVLAGYLMFSPMLPALKEWVKWYIQRKNGGMKGGHSKSKWQERLEQMQSKNRNL